MCNVMFIGSCRDDMSCVQTEQDSGEGAESWDLIRHANLLIKPVSVGHQKVQQQQGSTRLHLYLSLSLCVTRPPEPRMSATCHDLLI